MSEQIQIKVKCQKCHEVLAPDAQFCHGCGIKIGGVSACASCKTPIDPDWNVCPNCGKALKERPALPETYTDPTTGMQFVWVPGGCFQMGDTFGRWWQPRTAVHEVCVDGFYMGKYAVTQKQWAAVMGSSNPSKYVGENRPVETVSWDDAQGLIEKLNAKSGKRYRLPTEAEWEYAARSGGKKEKWAGTSSEKELENYAWYESKGGEGTHPVGQKQPNGLGLYDMSGNVWEWCSDWYDNYESGKQRNPQGPSTGSYRVVRGGGWRSDAGLTRASDRSRSTPGGRNDYLGFRLLLPPVQ